MIYLVLCPCDHSLEAHDAHGCKGDRGRSCACRLGLADALDAAVDAVRSTYARNPGWEKAQQSA